ncbi:hypothetical protein SCB71_13850 [Herbiconiux sp. KACC 21604]|uniref:hypothetical protein n=1 Tax=unclassified Herbiconiux TaxID=2618217 RepID=UPI0014913315|nr:hypothetical protein [Herbiconiux sp. SALV-R1]QJU54233.1 hypothetical protein HL652_11795 [Herbiconiux sp. SALV-R1]WPO85294.1 hypothetical protein SCB71_13850 [Herbiconiux sp. KACC 21604]
MTDQTPHQPGDDTDDLRGGDRPDAEELPDGSSSDGSESSEGEDTASGGGADQ